MSKLSIEDLLKNSSEYNTIHQITQADADNASDIYQVILDTRNSNKSMAGDIMICRFTGRNAYQ